MPGLTAMKAPAWRACSRIVESIGGAIRQASDIDKLRSNEEARINIAGAQLAIGAAQGEDGRIAIMRGIITAWPVRLPGTGDGGNINAGRFESLKYRSPFRPRRFTMTRASAPSLCMAVAVLTPPPPQWLEMLDASTLELCSSNKKEEVALVIVIRSTLPLSTSTTMSIIADRCTELS